MNTKTILNIKTDKDLKRCAQETAKELGITLTTVVNSLLKQFVRDKELTLSNVLYKPSKYLLEVIAEGEAELKSGKAPGPFKGVEEMLKSLDE